MILWTAEIMPPTVYLNFLNISKQVQYLHQGIPTTQPDAARPKYFFLGETKTVIVNHLQTVVVFMQMVSKCNNNNPE